MRLYSSSLSSSTIQRPGFDAPRPEVPRFTRKTSEPSEPDKPATPSPTPSFRLKNENGFWELTFDGAQAVLPQNQALFYLAWLLQHPAEAPLSTHQLALQVHERFASHPDFVQQMPWIHLPEDRVMAEKLSLLRQEQLEAILHDDLQFEPVKHEAMRELEQIHAHQGEAFLEFSQEIHRTTDFVDKMLLRLHGALTMANDPLGNPHPVQRAFAMHLLFYLFVPTILAGGYVYLPPTGVAWSSSGSSSSSSSSS
jgi:hypothetical protein